MRSLVPRPYSQFFNVEKIGEPGDEARYHTMVWRCGGVEGACVRVCANNSVLLLADHSSTIMISRS